MSALRTTVATVLACTLGAASGHAQASVDVIHAFAGLPGLPTGRLLQASSGLFYGTLPEGGPMAAGAVFAAALSAEGRLAPVALHVFNGSDGRWPTAGLIQASDGALYGTTFAGGASNRGTVFRITTRGQFTVLHSFGGLDGVGPFAELIQAADGLLYGTTTSGGSAQKGTVFKMTLAGQFTTVHSFTGPEGANPCGALLQASDGNFYGTAYAGGIVYTGGAGGGTVFRLTPGGNVDVLYRFDASKLGDGLSPVAGLIQGQDGALYGTTTGAQDRAWVFRITMSGDLTVLFSFKGTDSALHFGGLIQGQDGALYGTCVGLFRPGMIFRMGMDGALTVLHTFTGNDGETPFGGLMQARDGSLYGLTRSGGDVDRGTVYRITTAGLFTSLYSFSGRGGDGPSGGVIRASDGNFYGTTAAGGLRNAGTVFRLTAGGAVTTVHDFTGADGASPDSGLLQGADGVLYGMTNRGGSDDRGTVFAMTLAGGFQTLHTFTAAEHPWAYPPIGSAPLIQGRDGMLYGISAGQYAQPSVVFQITPAGAFTVLATIDDAHGPLVEAADGNFYGTVAPPLVPFANDGGSVFRMTPAGVVTTVFEFFCEGPPFDSCPIGGSPAGGLVAARDGALYGVLTTAAGTGGYAVFRVDPAGVTVIAHLAGVGAAPTSRLIQSADGRLYGTAMVGSVAANAVYSVSSAGDPAIVHVFPAGEGASLSGPLLETEPGVFFGTASQGGVTTHGVVYRLTVTPGH